MDEQSQEVLLQHIDLMIEALQQQDVLLMKSISDRAIKSASLFQDPDSISIAVIAYSLSKIIERAKECGEDCTKLLSTLQQAKVGLQKNDQNIFKQFEKKMLEQISKMDSRLAMYVEEVIEKARIKKGSTLYEHGLSTGRVAELLGISKWELMSYICKTTIGEGEENRVSAKERLLFARSLFRR